MGISTIMKRMTLLKSTALVGALGLLAGVFIFSNTDNKSAQPNGSAAVELMPRDEFRARADIGNSAQASSKTHDDQYPVTTKTILGVAPEDVKPRPAGAPKYVSKDDFITLETELHALTTCQVECQLNIMKKLRAGQSLNPFELEALRLYAGDMTQTMPLTQEDLAMFEADLRADDGRRKAAARELLATLDTETQSRIGINLAGAPEAEYRLLGYEFLSRTAADDPEAAQHLRSSLTLETNKHILFEVIEASELEVANQILAGNSQARSLALDTLYSTHTDPDVRGSALEAQAKNIQNEGRMQGDIREALISGNADLQDYGLNSLSIILNRQAKQQSGANWNENGDIRLLVEGFATDPNADFEVRRRAERILERHFDN